jgi:NOL1/NOP2/fmu family ribosome biogenesis protein
VAVFRAGARAFAWPSDFDRRLLNVAISGPEIGFRKGTTWFPSYGLAMRRDPSWTPHARFPLVDEQAQRYVQGQSLSAEMRGWAVASWKHRALGWLKGDGHQAKNHLPKPGRIAAAAGTKP